MEILGSEALRVEMGEEGGKIKSISKRLKLE
jgi:hypothetical protein